MKEDLGEMATGETNAPVLGAILDNPEADRFISEREVARAVAEGMSPELARKLFG